MASAGSAANASAAAKFWDYFQQERAQIQALIEGSQDAGTRLRALDSALREAFIYLPGYDQKKLLAELEGLRTLLHKRNSASSRNTGFRFKAASTKPRTAAQPPPSKQPEPPLLAERPTQAPAGNSGVFSFTGVSNQWIVASSNLADNSAGSADCELRDISHCVIDLRPVAGSLRALNCHRVENSLIICGRFSGSATVRDSKHCVMVLGVRQLRFESSCHVDVYTYCTSHPIIEKSSDMRFAPYPQPFGLQMTDPLPNLYDKVEDFNWLKRQHSPNWSLIADDEPLSTSIWRLLEDQQGDGQLGRVLECLP